MIIAELSHGNKIISKTQPTSCKIKIVNKTNFIVPKNSILSLPQPALQVSKLKFMQTAVNTIKQNKVNKWNGKYTSITLTIPPNLHNEIKIALVQPITKAL